MEDINNHTYTVKIDQIYSPEGKSYHRVKYIPKIEKIKSYLALKPTNKLLDIGVGYGSFLNLIEETLDSTLGVLTCCKFSLCSALIIK